MSQRHLWILFLFSLRPCDKPLSLLLKTETVYHHNDCKCKESFFIIIKCIEWLKDVSKTGEYLRPTE
jgi:hypothetical protein